MTEEIGLPVFLEDVPATAILVWRILDELDRPADAVDLAPRCRRSERSVRKALVDLDAEGLVAPVHDPEDPSAPTRWRAVWPDD